MASIRKVVHRTGRMSWQARWRDPTGSQHSKNFGRRIDAERFLITVEARKLAGTYIDPRAGRIRLGEFTEQATAGWVNRRDSTKARDESYLRSLVLPVFADMPIGAISVFDVQEWVSDLDADGYAPATIRKAYQLLGRILQRRRQRRTHRPHPLPRRHPAQDRRHRETVPLPRRDHPPRRHHRPPIPGPRHHRRVHGLPHRGTHRPRHRPLPARQADHPHRTVPRRSPRPPPLRATQDRRRPTSRVATRMAARGHRPAPQPTTRPGPTA